MRTIGKDMRYAFRKLWNSPRLTAVVILVLALGVGANTAIFSVINGVLLKSLPVRNPQGLRVLAWTGSVGPIVGLSGDMRGPQVPGKMSWLTFPYPTYREFAEKAEGFSHLFAFSYVEDGLTIRAGGVPTVAYGLMVSGNFFDGYGAGVLFGRPLAPQDDRAGADPVAVITYRLWERYYNLDPHVLGQTLMINNAGFTIVGVLPERYRGPLHGDPADFYVPLATQADRWHLEDRRLGWIRIMGRLAPGANEAQALASLKVIFQRSIGQRPAEEERPGFLLVDGRHGLAVSPWGQSRELMFLQGLVGLVLLIACANVAGLLLAHSAGRHRELSVRAALGAGRWHLIRQSLVESLLLSLAGAAAGSLVPAVRRAVAEIDPDLPLQELTTQKLLLEKSLSPERTLRLLFVGLGVLALGLSCLGLYGLMAHHVASRTGEIGLRMALGARPADVSRPILCEAGRLALLGVALGLPLALALARVLGAVLFGVAPYDPATLIFSALTLVAVAVGAAWLPARCAAGIDPMVALRCE